MNEPPVLIAEPGLHNLQAHLLIMETIFNNSIKSNYTTPEYTLNNKPLKPHQNRLITTLWSKEEQLRSGRRFRNEMLFSKVGFIADPINSGLFQTIIGYLKHCKTRRHDNSRITLHNYSSPICFSLIPSNTRHNNTTLFIVSNIYLQTLKQLLEEQLDITHLIIKRQNQLSHALLDTLANLDLLIVPASQAVNTIRWMTENNYSVNRCFIDDLAANNIHARDLEIVNAEFTWLLTEHWTKLIWPDLDFADLESVLTRTLHSIIPNPSKHLQDYIQYQKLLGIHVINRSLLHKYVIYHPSVSNLIVLSDPDAIRDSMQLTAENRIELKYSHDEPLQILYSISSAIVGNQIANNNIIGAMQSIGAQIIAPSVWANERNSYIRQDDTDENCPICYENLVYPTVTDCCKKRFCAACILHACRSTNTSICPMCRGHLFGNRLLMVAEMPPLPNYVYESKLRVLCNYIAANQTKKQLLYFPYEPRLGKLRAVAKLKNISLNILTGTYYDCKRKIELFNQNNNGGILVITDLKQLHGLQLPSTAILIVYPDNIAPSILNVLRMHTYGLAREEALEVAVFVEDAALVTAVTEPAANPGAAPAACGVVNTSLGDASVAASHT